MKNNQTTDGVRALLITNLEMSHDEMSVGGVLPLELVAAKSALVEDSVREVVQACQLTVHLVTAQRVVVVAAG